MKQGYMLVSKKGYMVVLPKVDDGVKAGVGASVEEGVGVSLNTFVNGSDEFSGFFFVECFILVCMCIWVYNVYQGKECTNEWIV